MRNCLPLLATLTLALALTSCLDDGLAQSSGNLNDGGGAAGSDGCDERTICISDGGGTTNGDEKVCTGSSNCIPCSGECEIVTTCDPGSETRVSGIVRAPNGRDPISKARVYVPDDEGEPVVLTETAANGTFDLRGIPAGKGVPIWVEKGGFLRELSLDVAACAGATPTEDQLRLPSKQSEGKLPKLAVGIGDYDQIECVLRSVGIDDSEFTRPDGAGAVHLYQHRTNVAGAELYGLFSNREKMDVYDLIFVNCTSNLMPAGPNEMTANIQQYVDGGGRLYATDWAYDYIEQVPEFAPYIDFYGGGSGTASEPPHSMSSYGAAVSLSSGPLQATISNEALAGWLVAAAGSATAVITDFLDLWVLMDGTSTDASFPTTTWAKASVGVTPSQAVENRPLTVTFDRGECGKVLYSSYHTRHSTHQDAALRQTGEFPTYCVSSEENLLAQERILEYLILEISACERTLDEPDFEQPPK